MKNIFLGIVGLLTFPGISCEGGINTQPPLIVEKLSDQEAIQMSQENLKPQYLYKVISIKGWEDSKQKNQVMNSQMDDKFIHLATQSQIQNITKKYWQGQRYFVLKLDPNKMKGRLVFEANPGGTTQYYHLYEGIIPLDAVIDISPADQ